ncbi:MAG TPA: PQQ-binding-like beta-propeller repeat protein [Salegentibacter sp.]|uniref:outer membrane protein assembly factor BamB family protein n=1 Tax=Salegentibacter sp. TaxID=1903072 RepID=UPI002F945647
MPHFKFKTEKKTIMTNHSPHTIHIALSLLLLFLFSSCDNRKNNTSQDKGMFMSDSQHTGKYNSESVKKEPDILWKVKTAGQVISSPVLVDNMLYVGSEDHKLYAIDATKGTVKWTYETNGPVNSSPLVAKGKVMFLSYDGFFYALNQADGKLVWKFKTEGESKFKVKDYYNGSFKPDFWDFYLSSAIVNNNQVYFGSSDSHVYSLNIESGEMIWNYKTEASIHSSPAIFENSLLIGSWDSKIYSLDIRNGKENWTYTTGRDTARYIWQGVQASTSVENGIAYIGSRDAKFYAFNIETGDTLWTNNNFDRSWMPSTAAIGKKNLYTGSSDSFRFFSINKENGTINYATKTKAYTFSSPAIDGEMAYIGSANGRLYGIELNNGDVKWEFQTIGCRNDTLDVFNSEGERDMKKLKSLTANISDMPTLSSLYTDIFIDTGAILSSPVIANQVIYFGSSDGFIYAITDKS